MADAFRPRDFIRSSCLIDIVSATEIYYGYYSPNTTRVSGGVADPAIAQFQIMKETRDGSGNTIKIQFADVGFNQIWNDRLTLTYL